MGAKAFLKILFIPSATWGHTQEMLGFQSPFLSWKWVGGLVGQLTPPPSPFKEQKLKQKPWSEEIDKW